MEIHCLNSKNKYDWNIPSGKGEIKILCPECSHTRKKSNDKCMTWNTEKDVGHCHHCEADFVKINPNFTQKKDYQKKEYKKPETVGLELYDSVVEHFISKRHISRKTLDIAKVTNSPKYSPEKKKETLWIRFDYYKNGELVNSKYKSPQKDFSLEAGAELIFYNLDSVATSDYAIITEGEEDCLSFIEAGYLPTMSVPNGANTNLTYVDNCYDNISHIKTFYIAVDGDAKGRILKDELVRRFGVESCKIISFSKYFKADGNICKDANDVLIYHGIDAIKDCFDSAIDVPLKGVYNIEESKDDIIDLWESGMPRGNKTTHAELNQYITWITPALAIWTGIPSHGKSEFVDEVAINLNILHDWKVAYYSPENFPIKLHVSKIISKVIGKRFSKDCMSKDELEQGLSYVKDNFYFLYQEEELTDDDADDMTIDRILQQAKGLIRRRGIKQLIIDPISRISDYTDKNADTKIIGKILNKLDRFAKSNDILIHLVAHPTKMRKEKGSNEYEVPSLYDISGSANFFNSAFYGLTVYRRELDVEIHINKVKFKHLGNKGIAKFKYHFDSGRYISVDESFDNIESFLNPPENITDFEVPNFDTPQQSVPQTNNDIQPCVNFYETDYSDNNECPF